MTTIADFTVETGEGKPLDLAEKQGKVLLVVNTASQCGFTPQYEGLEALQRKYVDQGFEVLGFPCNQFGAQEPGSAEEIASFCKLNYDVSFPLIQLSADEEDRGQRRGRESALHLDEGRSARRDGHQGDQMELHQVPDRPRG